LAPTTVGQTSGLIHRLKQTFKAYGKTYAAVFRELGFTEASVKKKFRQTISYLKRFEQAERLLLAVTSISQCNT